MIKHKKFTGKLAEELEPLALTPGLGSPFAENHDLYSKLLELRRNEEIEKLKLLIDHYGIDESHVAAFASLSLELARQFVPGFQEKQNTSKSRGRVKKWGVIQITQIYGNVHKLISEDPKVNSVKQACKVLAKEEYWKDFIQQYDTYYTAPDPAEALRQAYYQIKPLMKRDRKERNEQNIVLKELRKKLLSP
jgi:hypothetical protein